MQLPHPALAHLRPLRSPAIGGRRRRACCARGVMPTRLRSRPQSARLVLGKLRSTNSGLASARTAASRNTPRPNVTSGSGAAPRRCAPNHQASLVALGAIGLAGRPQHFEMSSLGDRRASTAPRRPAPPPSRGLARANRVAQDSRPALREILHQAERTHPLPGNAAHRGDRLVVHLDPGAPSSA